MRRLVLQKKLPGFHRAVLATILAFAATRPASGQTSVVIDPARDVFFHAPAFQDIVRGEVQRKGGSFVLRMEVAGPMPQNPKLPPPGINQIWWAWVFDLDSTTDPKGYPFAPGVAVPPEFMVYVAWDGAEFRAYAIDRRPLLTGKDAIVTVVPFSIDGVIVEAVLASALIGNLPSFHWGTRT